MMKWKKLESNKVNIKEDTSIPTWTVTYMYGGEKCAIHIVKEGNIKDNACSLIWNPEKVFIKEDNLNSLPQYTINKNAASDEENLPYDDWWTRQDENGKINKGMKFTKETEVNNNITVYMKLCDNDSEENYNTINHYGLNNVVGSIIGPYCPLRTEHYTEIKNELLKKFKKAKETKEKFYADLLKKHLKLEQNLEQEYYEKQYKKLRGFFYDVDRKNDAHYNTLKNCIEKNERRPLLLDSQVDSQENVGAGNGFTSAQKSKLFHESWIRNGDISTDVEASIYAFGTIGDWEKTDQNTSSGKDGVGGTDDKTPEYYFLVKNGQLKVISVEKWEEVKAYNTNKYKEASPVISEQDGVIKTNKEIKYESEKDGKKTEKKASHLSDATMYSSTDKLKVKPVLIKTFRSDHDFPGVSAYYKDFKPDMPAKRPNDKVLVPAKWNQKAVVPPINEAQVDHIHPENWLHRAPNDPNNADKPSGSNSYCNAAIISAIRNRNPNKSNKTTYDRKQQAKKQAEVNT